MNSKPSSPVLLVLAAGMGSRYGGLKQIEPVGAGGEALLDYSVYDALRAGFRKVVFVIRRDFEAVFRERIGRRFESRLEVGYVFQEQSRLPAGYQAPAAREKPWGTGHAVWCAAQEIHESFAVINGDDFYGADSFQLIARFLAAADTTAVAVPCCMAGFRLANTLSNFDAVSRGICQVDVSGHLRTVEECTALTRHEAGAQQVNADGRVRRFSGSEIVSLNCWGFGCAIFPGLERALVNFLADHAADSKAEFYLPVAVEAIVAEGAATVTVLPASSNWFGITYREDRPRVVAELEALVAAGIYPERLWET
ncbi:MAG: NTP transferase domain-containing protein [bacterium]|nr:NTP transferase domain-containing protein [bacterium]